MDTLFCKNKYFSPEILRDLKKEDIVKFTKYFFKVSKNSILKLTPKPHVVASYDPFADRSKFPAGVRYCVNTYTGCSHFCGYCYVSNYIRNSNIPRPKKDFVKRFNKDITEIKALSLPPVPIHMSNSTDPLQEEMERQFKHTLYTLNTIAENLEFFSVVTILTKNPKILLEKEYSEVLHKIKKLRIQVSLAFWNNDNRKHYEPGAPSVQERLTAIAELCRKGFNTIIRIDPLFPREPLPKEYFQFPLLREYEIHPAHTFDDIKNLIDFAKTSGCSRVVISPLKVICGRFADKDFSKIFYPLYKNANKGGAFCRGFAYRLPDSYVKDYLLEPVIEYCNVSGIECMHCKHDLCSTK